jgi:hypothetical protein
VRPEGYTISEVMSRNCSSHGLFVELDEDLLDMPKPIDP